MYNNDLVKKIHMTYYNACKDLHAVAKTTNNNYNDPIVLIKAEFVHALKNLLLEVGYTYNDLLSLYDEAWVAVQ